MHFKLFSLALVFAFASAAFLGGKAISVQDDGTQVRIVDQRTGREVVIYRESGLAYEVTVVGPVVGVKTLRVNDVQGGRIVSTLLAENQGIIGDVTYEQILNTIERQVQIGNVHPKFVQVLRLLSNNQLYLGEQQEIVNIFNNEIIDRPAVEKDVVVGDLLDKELTIDAVTKTNPASQRIQNTLTVDKKTQLEKEALVKDILKKLIKVQAITQIQQEIEITKDLLRSQVQQQQQQVNIGYHTFYQTGVSRQLTSQNIYRKLAKIEALTEAQQKIQVVKQILKQEIVQNHVQLTGQVGEQELQILLGRFGIQQQWGQLSFEKQIEIAQEALVDTVLRKQAKIEALTQVQREIEVVKDILKKHTLRQQVNSQVSSTAGLQVQYGLNGRLGDFIENTDEDILDKEAKIQALIELQQKIEATKTVLKRQVAQEKLQLNNVGLSGLQGQNYGLEGQNWGVEGQNWGLQRQIYGLQQQNYGLQGQQWSNWNLPRQNWAALNNLDRYQVPLVYQTPSIWNQIRYTSATPYSVGGFTGNLRGLHQQPWGQQLREEQIQQQLLGHQQGFLI